MWSEGSLATFSVKPGVTPLSFGVVLDSLLSIRFIISGICSTKYSARQLSGAQTDELKSQLWGKVLDCHNQEMLAVS